MARKRVSMREGPLAELFRATEAAQDRKARGAHPRKQEHTAQTEILSVVPDEGPAPEPSSQAPHAEEPPAARWLEPLPENPARLERPRDSASYLAVIRVVGVSGAGLNALDRMIARYEALSRGLSRRAGFSGSGSSQRATGGSSPCEG